MSAKENKAVVLRFIDEVFVQHDSSNIEELVANESLRQIAPGTVQAFPDIEMTVEDVIAEGDLVAVRVSAAATQPSALVRSTEMSRPSMADGSLVALCRRTASAFSATPF